MDRFIKTPNLPERKITSVLVDYRMNHDSIKKLNSLGIKVYTIKRTDSLYSAVSGHPDMVMHHLGGDLFVISPEDTYISQKFIGMRCIVGESLLEKKYPVDIAYNAARVGKFLIHNFKYTDKIILKNTSELIKINVNQGYSKCNVCVVAENAIITSDVGIAKSCCKFGLDVLIVNDSNIKLESMSNGFIGGTTGLISPDTLAVNGNIAYHKNADEIINFCKKYGVEVLSLNNGFLEDVGSIIAITE